MGHRHGGDDASHAQPSSPRQLRRARARGPPPPGMRACTPRAPVLLLVRGGAVEEAEDLRHVVLVHAQVVEPPHVLVAEGLVLLPLSPKSRARPPGRSAIGRQRRVRRTWKIISFSGSVLSQRSTLPIATLPEELRVDLEEHDHAPLRAEIADVVPHRVRELHDGAGRERNLVAVDVSCGPCPRARRSPLPSRGCACMTVDWPGRNRRSPTRAARLEQHLRTRLSAAKLLQRVQVEHLSHAGAARRAVSVHHRLLAGGAPPSLRSPARSSHRAGCRRRPGSARRRDLSAGTHGRGR